MSDIPKLIGKYKIESLIAKGGMGEVYKGTHPTLNRFVILKKLTLDNHEQFIERFNREARIMMDFKNDNIVDVYDHFKEGNSYYIVLEYIDGIALDKFIQKERYLSNDLALYITGEISKALKYAHNKNVIHRDIKPGNILLSKTGEVKLVDFGIAASEDEEEQDLTREGMTLGTPSYMAPEQFSNSKNVDQRADIYSIGVILYEMVTGKKPYSSGISAESIAKIQKGRHKSPKKINPNINKTVMSLIKKLMKPKVKKRVQDLSYINLKLQTYFKRADLNKFKKRISDSVQGNEVVEIPVKKRRNKVIPIAITILTIVLSALFYVKNSYYEIIKRSDYGLVSFNVNVGEQYYKDSKDLIIISKLYNENQNDLTYIEDMDLTFKIQKESSNRVFSSGKVYLPIGKYRIKISIEGNLFWKNFTINSRLQQKLLPYTKQGLNIVFGFKKQKPLPFYSHIKVYDSVSGSDISNSTDISIKNGKTYVKYNPLDETLKTDNIYFFNFSKEGYFDKEFILKIQTEQTDLSINVDLFPKPGKVHLFSNTQGIKIKLNNQNSYIKGDLTNEVIKLPEIGKNITDLVLSPGNYEFLFAYKGKTITTNYLLKSGTDFNIEINYNKDEKSLIIKE